MLGRPLLVALGSAALVACSSDSIKDPTPGPGGGPGPAAGSCKGPGYREMGIESQQVDSFSAELVDLEGEPVAGELVQVCGLDLCTNGTSDSRGGVAITPGQSFLKPAFKFGEGRESARFAILLPDDAEIDLGVVHTVRLPDITTSVPLAAGETASHGGLSLTLAAKTEIWIDAISFQSPAEKGLRAVRVPLADAPTPVGDGPGLELVYAATPVEARFCPGASLAVDNSEGWEAGTAVEIWVHGVDITEEWAPYGGWGLVADAVVSGDGERIESVGAGLPVLGVLGFRRAD